MPLTYVECELQATVAMTEERIEEVVKRVVKLSREEAIVPGFRRLVPSE